jgi:hypothetical protein
MLLWLRLSNKRARQTGTSLGMGCGTHHILSVVEYDKQLAAILDADAEIVERLLTVEQAYAEVHQQLTQLQFHLVELEHQQAEEQRQTRRQSQRQGGKTQTDDSTE